MNISTMKEKSIKFKSKLRLDHELFKQLHNNPPAWWKIVKAHPDLYIEIRKDNYINIYYKGGSIAKVEYDDDTDKIVATAHYKYLGCDDSGVHKSPYRNCEEWLEHRLDELLANIDEHYGSKEKQEQARMILHNRTLYLDSEFQHLYGRTIKEDLSSTTKNKVCNVFMRIDLVEVRNNVVRFVELKMINDGRLLKKDDNSAPEIYEQMQKYRNFAERYSVQLREYYKTLYNVKVKLDLPVSKVDVEKLQINTKPFLVIACDYEKTTKGRTERIKRINRKMMQKSDVFDYEKLDEENYADNCSQR